MPCMKSAYARFSFPGANLYLNAEKGLKESISKSGLPYPDGFSVDPDSFEKIVIDRTGGTANVTVSGIIVSEACDARDEDRTIGIPAGSCTVRYCLKLNNDEGSSWEVLSYEVTNPGCKEKCSGTCCFCTRYLDFETLIKDLRFQRLYCSTVDCPADEEVVQIPQKNGAVELRLYDRGDKCHHGKYCTYVAEKKDAGYWMIIDKKCPQR